MRSRTLLLILIALIANGCSRRHEHPPVIIISVDTLRSDHLPAYGYREVATPNIDALARDGVVYTNAWSHVPLTLPSHVSILSGLLPTESDVHDNLGFPFDASHHRTIASILRENGYRTLAAVSAYVLRGSSGISSGFDVYDDSITAVDNAAAASLQRSGTKTLDALWRAMSQKSSKPDFVFLHLYEPHAPYSPPEPYRSRYANPYDGEIATADAVVGDFIHRLKFAGIYNRALIIFLSDHGEGLGDHGESEHGLLLYREELQVPLIIKYPLSTRRGRSDDLVELTDIAPTILESAGIAAPKEMGGDSIHVHHAPHAIYSETIYPLVHYGWSPLRSLTDGTAHLISGRRDEMFDLTTDPHETKNVRDRDRRVATRFQQILAEMPPLTNLQPRGVTAEESAKLAALGYIGAASPSRTLLDPRDETGELEDARSAFELAAARKYDEAIPQLKNLVERHPDWSDAWDQLGASYDGIGDAASALDAYRHGIAAAPPLATEFALSIATDLVALHRFDEARQHLQLAMRSHPAAAHQLLGEIALASNDIATAKREADLAMRDASQAPSAAVLHARIAIAQHDDRAAIGILNGALTEAERSGAPPPPRLLFTHGDLLARRGETARARKDFEREIELYPDTLDAYTSLALLEMIAGRPGDAKKQLVRMTSQNPSARTWNYGAQFLESIGDHADAAVWRKRAAAQATMWQRASGT